MCKWTFFRIILSYLNFRKHFFEKISTKEIVNDSFLQKKMNKIQNEKHNLAKEKIYGRITVVLTLEKKKKTAHFVKYFFFFGVFDFFAYFLLNFELTICSIVMKKTSKWSLTIDDVDMIP